MVINDQNLLMRTDSLVELLCYVMELDYFPSIIVFGFLDLEPIFDHYFVYFV